MSNEIKEEKNENKIILNEEEDEKEEKVKEEEEKEEKGKEEKEKGKEEKEKEKEKKEEKGKEVQKKEEEKEGKEKKEKEKEKEKEEKKNDDKGLEYEKPLYSDESKTIYKINNTPLIKEISILKTKNNPPTRCYLTADFSNKNNSIICIGGSDKSCEQYNIINEYSLKNNSWKSWNNDEQIEFGLELSGHSSNLIKLSKKEYIFIFGGYDNWKKQFNISELFNRYFK